MKCHSTTLTTIAAVILIASAGGCSISRMGGTAPLPVAFTAPPTMEQVVYAINANSSRVQQLHSTSVQLSVPGEPLSLNGTLDFERSPTPSESPGRFRLGGEIFGSRQLDLGSNDREYWMWVKQWKPPMVLWGRHADFYRSAAREILPVPPSFIVDAMGLVSIDPNTVTHEEPYESSSQVAGVLEIRTVIPTPRGNLTRVFQVDQEKATILQQAVYDTNVEPPLLLAVADASRFTYDNQTGVILPRTMKVKLPPAGLAFDFEVDNYTINEPISDPDSLWSMPRLDGHQYLDLANPKDMRGMQLGGIGPGKKADPYDSQPQIAKPIRPETPFTAQRLFNRILR